MASVIESINRDGIALARVHPQFVMDVTRYGARDPVGMIKFRIDCIPDISSWKINEVCVLTTMYRLDSRIRLAGEVSFKDPELHSSKVALGDIAKSLTLAHFATDINVFRDLLLTLLRRFYSAWAELKVSLTFLM
jgi:hypothetical protein